MELSVKSFLGQREKTSYENMTIEFWRGMLCNSF